MDKNNTEQPQSDTIRTLFELIESKDCIQFIETAQRASDTETLNLEQPNEQGETLLFRASRKGLHRVVQYLLSIGANLECRDPCNFTPLHSAATYGHFR